MSLFSNIAQKTSVPLFPSVSTASSQSSGTSLFSNSSASRKSLFGVSHSATQPAKPLDIPTKYSVSEASPASSGATKASPLVRRRQSIVVSQSVSRKYSRLHNAPGSSRRRTSDEISPNDTTSDIILRSVPESVNTKDILRAKFQKFGPIMRIYPNQSKNSAIIHFKSVDSARRAKEEGRCLDSFENVLIFFHKRQRTQRDDISSLSHGDALKARKRHIASDVRDSQSLSKMVKINRIDSLKGTVAVTSVERLKVLDRHDQLTRLAINKLPNSSRLSAACPDMCPERERYARQEQHRLSVFEIIPGSQPSQVDHRRAVKEYSRSSADQETPLPHDLRPLHVLVRTMYYLLSEIADACIDSNQRVRVGWSEWFDFLWNRTRAIRKEITQQRLCDVTTAVIVEQTARFHIFAAARLCELPVDEFDQKINDENLTKCLQTLKEIYQDLSLAGTRSPNEAEFRSYMILRNLNDTNILNDVTQLNPEIRSSIEVRLALSAYFALSSSNYIRFFKVVKKASFLQACLMHRSFNDVRWKALNIMIRAYTPPGKASNVMQFPLNTLVEQLAFESIEAAVAFCGHHKLKCSNDTVLFTRSAISYPNESLPIHRALKVVESKLGNQRIGDILNGSPLPILNELKAVSSSFDSDNKFIGSHVDPLVRSLSDEGDEALIQRQEDEDEVEDLQNDDVDQNEEDDKKMEENDEVEDDSSAISDSATFDDELEEGEIREHRSSRKSIVKEEHTISASMAPQATMQSTSSIVKTLSCQDVAEDLVNKTVNDLTLQVVSNFISVEVTHVVVETIGVALMNEVVSEMLTNIARIASQEAQAVLNAESLASSDVIEDVVSAFIHDECRNISCSIIQDKLTEEKIFNQIVMDIRDDTSWTVTETMCREIIGEEIIRRNHLRKFWNRWIGAVRCKKLRRDALLLIAAGPPLEHSRLITRRLFGDSGPKPSMEEISASVSLPTPGERFLKAVEDKTEQFFTPLSPSDFPLNDAYRLLMLLGRTPMSLFLSEWLFAKLDLLPFIDPLIMRPNQEDVPLSSGKQVIGIICIGNDIPCTVKSFPLLVIVEDDASSTSSFQNILHLFPDNDSTWNVQLEVGLGNLLSAANKRIVEDNEVINCWKTLSLAAFLDTYFHNVISDALVALQSARNRLELVDPPPQRLLLFYVNVIDFLMKSAIVSEDVMYRFVHLLELSDPLNYLKIDVNGKWATSVKAVNQFMQHQHLSHRCKVECEAIMQQSQTDWREMARDYDLHKYINPPIAVFPWIRLFMLWVDERANEVLRLCNNDAFLRSIIVNSDVGEQYIQQASKLAATMLLGPPSDGEVKVVDVFKDSLEKARTKKWEHFAGRIRNCDDCHSPKLKSVDCWKTLRREIDELQASMQGQMDESLYLDQLFEKSS